MWDISEIKVTVTAQRAGRSVYHCSVTSAVTSDLEVVVVYAVRLSPDGKGHESGLAKLQNSSCAPRLCPSLLNPWVKQHDYLAILGRFSMSNFELTFFTYFK